MAQVIVTESSLENIAGAIRSKLGTQATYKPAQMAGAIAQIHGDPVLEELTTNANGTFTPSSGKDGFSRAIVNVANSYSSSDEGKVVSNGALVGQLSQGINANGTYNTTLKNEVVVNVPNSYSASDEGKVVSNGALVAQSSQSITENGTYDTTLKNQVTVNVSGGGSVLVPKTITQNGTYNPASDNADGYSQVVVNVSGGSSDIESWDLTNSFVGEKRGWALVARNVDIGNDGAIFDSTSEALSFPTGVAFPYITIELDMKSMVLQSGTHRRFLMCGADRGFVYRSTGVWAFYNNSWINSNISDGDFFDDCTVKVIIDASGYWHIYKDNVLVWEPSVALAFSNFMIGSTGGQSINNAVISGLRIY